MIVKNEREFHSLFVKMARERGWHVAQFRPARTQVGGETQWRTPVGADGKGYPDFTLVRERIFWAELKGSAARWAPSRRSGSTSSGWPVPRSTSGSRATWRRSSRCCGSRPSATSA
jgi:hypothetical protein